MTAQLLLAALGHPEPAAAAADAGAQARTVAWLEDTKIRALPLDARAALRAADGADAPAWQRAFSEVRVRVCATRPRRGCEAVGRALADAAAAAARPSPQYLSAVGCPVAPERRAEAVTWLLGHAVALEYSDAGARSAVMGVAAAQHHCGGVCSPASLLPFHTVPPVALTRRARPPARQRTCTRRRAC